MVRYVQGELITNSPIAVWLIFLGVFLCTKTTVSQIPELSFHHLSEQDGLSDGTNSFIYRDSRGFIWLSSLNGLNRYDGKNIRVYRTAGTSENSLPGNVITSRCFETGTGDLWFTTFESIACYRRKTDDFTSVRLHDEYGNLITEDYYAFHLDQNDLLWIRTGIDQKGTLHLYDIHSGKDSIVASLDGQRCQVIHDNGKIIGVASSIFNGRSGLDVTWLQDSDHITRERFFHESESSPIREAVFWNGYIEDKTKVWYGCGSGIVLLNTVTGEYALLNAYHGKPIGKVTSVEPWKEDFLLVSTQNQGLLILDKEKLSFVHAYQANENDNYSIRSNRINEVYLDPEGCVWLSFWGKGIDFAQIGKNKFKSINLTGNDDEPMPAMLSLVEDDSGFIWAAAGKSGLFVFNQEGQHVDSYFGSDKQNHDIRLLYLDPMGRLWAVSVNIDKQCTLWMLNRSESAFVEIKTIKQVPTDLLMLPDNRLLISSITGMYQLVRENDTWIYSPCREVQATETDIHRMFMDQSDRVYLSVNWNRVLVFQYTKERLTYVREIADVGNCRSYMQSPSGSTIWIASSNGLLKLDGKELKLTQPVDYTLPGENLYGLLIDKKQHLWLKSKNGLIEFDPDSGQTITYSAIDGVHSSILDVYSECLTRSGRLWFGGAEGICLFDPAEIKPLSIQAKPQIIEILVNDEAYSSRLNPGEMQALRLPYRENTISLNFVACEYSEPGSNEFQYLLEGYDEHWVDNGKLGFARYANLPSGEYTFKLKASNSDGIWSPPTEQLSLSIQPPWWDTWWARTFYLLAALGLLWYFRHMELKKQKRKLALQEEKLAHQRQVNEELRKIDQLKDQFLANTSHELRTPLNGIIGLAESLKDGIAGRLPEKANEHLDMIKTSGRRLATLVNDILDFTKLKNYDLDLDIKPLDLHAATDVVLTLSRPMLRNKKISLLNRVPTDIPLIEADENRIQQILHNLIGNAIKFTDDGAITVSAREKSDVIEVTIADTGIGIPEDKLDSIFKSFEQVDGTEEREHGGTGLGLSVTRQLIELHGGTIDVESQVGVGSKFIFTMPRSEMKREEMDEEQKYDSPEDILVSKVHMEEDITDYGSPEVQFTPENISGAEKSHILVVDDEPVNLQVVKNHLQMAGYEVTDCSSGQEALDLIFSGKTFDLVLLDVMMPRLSGYEVCRQIRGKYMASELPIVLLTAKNRITNLIEGFDAGANDYLTKPFSKDELLSRIKTHLNLFQIHKATGKFVPYKFLRAIGRKLITDVRLGDQAQKNVTVFFSDIRDYTTLAEHMSPTENFRFVNSYVGRMGPIIHQFDGFVHQYLGDGIMAIFPQQADNSLQGAIHMQKEITRYNLYRKTKNREPIRAGMGLHSGPLIMGIIGDTIRSEPASIADTVNLASRLEGLTKYYGAKILFSESSLLMMENPEKFNYRYIGRIQVKGKEEVIKAYECFDGDDEPLFNQKLETIELFNKARDLFFAREFLDAVVIFKELVEQPVTDPVATYFYKKAAIYVRDGVPDDWTGVETMDIK